MIEENRPSSREHLRKTCDIVSEEIDFLYETNRRLEEENSVIKVNELKALSHEKTYKQLAIISTAISIAAVCVAVYMAF